MLFQTHKTFFIFGKQIKICLMHTESSLTLPKTGRIIRDDKAQKRSKEIVKIIHVTLVDQLHQYIYPADT